MYDCKPHRPYRIARTAKNKNIAGKVVVFLGYVTRFDGCRAKVAIMQSSGGCGEEWLVSPNIITNL